MALLVRSIWVWQFISFSKSRSFFGRLIKKIVNNQTPNEYNIGLIVTSFKLHEIRFLQIRLIYRILIIPPSKHQPRKDQNQPIHSWIFQKPINRRTNLSSLIWLSVINFKGRSFASSGAINQKKRIIKVRQLPQGDQFSEDQVQTNCQVRPSTFRLFLLPFAMLKALKKPY